MSRKRRAGQAGPRGRRLQIRYCMCTTVSRARHRSCWEYGISHLTQTSGSARTQLPLLLPLYNPCPSFLPEPYTVAQGSTGEDDKRKEKHDCSRGGTKVVSSMIEVGDMRLCGGGWWSLRLKERIENRYEMAPSSEIQPHAQCGLAPLTLTQGITPIRGLPLIHVFELGLGPPVSAPTHVAVFSTLCGRYSSPSTYQRNTGLRIVN